LAGLGWGGGGRGLFSTMKPLPQLYCYCRYC
jgi:hypothetical protein